MRKYIKLIVGLVLMSTVVACSDDVEKGGGKEQNAKSSVVKTLTYKDSGWEETFTFIYQDDKKISKIVNSYAGGGSESTFDWSQAGKMTMTKVENSDPTNPKTSKYEVNEAGYITKAYESDGINHYLYEYNEDGILSKVTESWDGVLTVKQEAETKAGNVLKIKSKRSGKDYEKVFEVSTGPNLCGIQQTNLEDSYWKMQSGLFGKASNRLILSLEYGNVGETKTYSKLTYKFDEFVRPTEIVRSMNDWTETVYLTYYED